MLFSLSNTLATFQKYINNILYSSIDLIYIIYLDNIFIYSKNKAKYIQYIYKILLKLQDIGLYINLKKYKFSINYIDFLGFIIT